MATDKKVFTLRVQDSTYEKVRYLAFSDRRSVSMEMEHILLEYIDKYESIHGEIAISSPSEEEK